VIHRDEDEEMVALGHETLSRGKRSAVAPLPLVGIDRTYAAGSDLLDHCGYRAGLIADDNHDLFDARSKQSPNRALDKWYTPGAHECFRSPTCEWTQPLRSPGSEYDADPG
jgi:hypothetical protein